jgi:glucosylceramidase
MKMLTITPKSKFLHLLFTGILLCVFIIRSSGQKRDFKEAQIYITSQATQQLLANRGFTAFEPLEQPDENYPTIMIDINKTFQTIEGFGGAFTDASAFIFAKLSKDLQEKILKANFDPVEGNGYTLCRTTIHSADYSE